MKPPNPAHIELTLRLAILILTVVSLVTSGVTYIFTKLFDAHSMAKKYRLLTDAENCMKAREENEKTIATTLEQLSKRLILGNLMLVRLWNKAGIHKDEIEMLEKSVGIKIND